MKTLIATAVLLAGSIACADAQSTVPYYPIPREPAAPSASAAANGDSSDSAGAERRSLPTLEPILPGPDASEYGRAPAPTYAPPAVAAGQFAPAPNPGPVTGYGIGGMQTPPGAPPNPPYTH
jgi:hypothetical protein